MPRYYIWGSTLSALFQIRCGQINRKLSKQKVMKRKTCFWKLINKLCVLGLQEREWQVESSGPPSSLFSPSCLSGCVCVTADDQCGYIVVTHGYMVPTQLPKPLRVEVFRFKSTEEEVHPRSPSIFSVSAVSLTVAHSPWNSHRGPERETHGPTHLRGHLHPGLSSHPPGAREPGMERGSSRGESFHQQWKLNGRGQLQPQLAMQTHR